MDKNYPVGEISTIDIPIATTSQLGGIKAKPKNSSDTQEIHIDANGFLFTQVNEGLHTFEIVDLLPTATKEEYDQHKIYLQNNDLHFIIKKSSGEYVYKRIVSVEE